MIATNIFFYLLNILSKLLENVFYLIAIIALVKYIKR